MNNDCENVVLLWINKRTGKIMVNVQTNPNYTYSSNTSNAIGKRQKMSSKSKNYKENWIYDIKRSYEYCMNNPSDAREVSKEFAADFDIDQFATIAIYFTNEQEGFDFRNQLVNILKKKNLTYNEFSIIKSRINRTEKTPRVYDFLVSFENTLNEPMKDLPLHMEKMFYNVSRTDFYSEQLEDINKLNNDYTRSVVNKIKAKAVIKKFCKHCGIEVSLAGICDGFRCDYSGEKVETYEKEVMR